MNLETLRQQLLFIAHAHPPTDRVPYAFEKRILARLAQSPVLDLSALWARALWRAAAPCVALTLLEIEDRSVKDIAQITGWSVPLVKVRAFRARAEMRKILARLAKDKFL